MRKNMVDSPVDSPLATVSALLHAPSRQQLAVLASRAALEFDCANKGNFVGFESATTLAAVLSEAMKSDSDGGFAAEHSAKYLAHDLMTTCAVGQALRDINYVETSDLKDIVEKAFSVIAALKTKSEEYSDCDLRDFCVALVEELLSDQEGPYDFTPQQLTMVV